MDSQAQAATRRFPALGVPHFRLYAATTLLSMAGDNVEHVIGYWVIWQLTHSNFWLGYAVVAHWLPFTFFSFYSGSLADRVDCRRLLQVTQALYIVVSFGWGFLYLTGGLQTWHIAILLVLHGIAGLIQGPSSMLIIHEMVGQEKLTSAISLNASLRPLSTTLGPIIGGFLMMTLGPGWGFFLNILIYLPLSAVLFYLPYRGAAAGKPREAGWAFIFEGLRVVRRSPTIVAILVVMAATSLLVGNAFQAFIPAFAERLGLSSGGYSIMLSANGLGAILGGLLLGWTGMTKLRPIMVTAGALLWSLFALSFAFSTVYALSLVFLLMVGLMQLVFSSMAQSIVQAWAPPALRGRVVGVYNFSAHGMRALSGFAMGSLAGLLGAPYALSLLAGIIAIVILGASLVARAMWNLEMKEGRPETAEPSPVIAGT